MRSSVGGVSDGAPKRRAVSSKPSSANCSSMLHALRSQLWMYRAFSGNRSTRHAEIVTVRAMRAASVSPISARSSRLERRDRGVAVEQSRGRTEELVALADRQHRVEGRDGVGEQRRVRHVAEVHDARDASVVVEERVVEREVAVHHLRAQPGPARQHPFLEPVEHAAHERPTLGVLDRGRHRAERQAVLDVPEQHAVGGRVEEPPHRPAEPRERLAVGPQRSVIEVDAVGRAAAGHERRHAHHVARATFLVAHGRDEDIGVAFGRERRRDRQRRVDAQRVPRGADLHVEHVGAFPGVRDLEDARLAVGRPQQEVLVALALEPTLHLAVEAERRSRARSGTSRSSNRGGSAVSTPVSSSGTASAPDVVPAWSVVTPVSLPRGPARRTGPSGRAHRHPRRRPSGAAR